MRLPKLAGKNLNMEVVAVLYFPPFQILTLRWTKIARCGMPTWYQGNGNRR